MKPTLVVLAAGMGSRYGGLKQIDPVGPAGEAVLDYSVFDALRAGFGRVVFVIRRDIESAFREAVGNRFEPRMEVDYAFQELDSLPEGFTAPPERTKPWGTAHAVWAARDRMHTPFAVINADDFYGRHAYRVLTEFLRQPTVDTTHETATYAMVGYRLGNTLSDHGSVSRGICTADPDGFLVDIEEHTGIVRCRDHVEAIDGSGATRRLTGDEVASMNLWGFGEAVFDQIEEHLAEFLRERRQEPKSELYLPFVINRAIAEGRARVRVLETDGTWFGVTYRDDRPAVEKAIGKLIDTGAYPTPLWQ